MFPIFPILKTDAKMIKMIATLKKKEGMSTQDFRSYYENYHRLIGEKYLADYAVRYVRRYLAPMPDAPDAPDAQGDLVEPEYDVLLEIWFPDESAFVDCANKLREPDVAREIMVDEEKLFDRSQKRKYIVEECESVLRD